jgi:hypothetical protein
MTKSITGHHHGNMMISLQFVYTNTVSHIGGVTSKTFVAELPDNERSGWGVSSTTLVCIGL